MLQVLFNTYITDESNDAIFANPVPADAGFASVLCTAHISGVAPSGVEAATKLLQADSEAGPFEVIAQASCAGPGSSADTITHVQRSAMKAVLKVQTIGAGGNPDGGGTIAIVF
jgi:hypothetical protein